MSQSAAFWVCLALAVPTFWALPLRWRMPFLASVSLLYVLNLDVWVGFSMLGWALLCYWLPRQTILVSDAARRFGFAVVVGLLFYLAYFKYLPSLFKVIGTDGAKQFLVPLGLSYFCFKLIHYVIESRRKGFSGDNFSSYLSYVFLFPIFTAGPIERYDHFLQHRTPSWQRDHAVEGLTRLVHGLIKKFILCEVLLLPRLRERDGVVGLVQIIDVMPVWSVWLFFIASFLYLYLDFSAYSDMAIGASRLFGLRIAENFRWPILAANIADFWKRWHLSLSNWCQTYVYLPVIGITRRPILATYASFFAMGLWHSASWGWIAWAVTHASGVVAYGYWSRARRRWRWRLPEGPLVRVLSMSLTIAFVALAGVFTALDGKGTPMDAMSIFGRMFGL